MDKSTEEVLSQNFCIWATSTSGWAGTDKLLAEDLGKDPDEIPDIFRLGSKFLLPRDDRISLQASSQVSQFMGTIGRPFIQRSQWLVPIKLVLMAKEGMEKIKARRGDKVELMLTNYEEIKRRRIVQYPVLADASWPTPDEIRDKFSVKWLVYKIEGVGSASQTDPETLQEVYNEFRGELVDAYKDFTATILKEAHVAIMEACDEISNKVLVTGEKITETSLKRPRRIIEKYDGY